MKEHEDIGSPITRSDIIKAKELLVAFDEKYPGTLKQGNVADVVAHLMKKNKESI
jgi:hypothetical protein